MDTPSQAYVSDCDYDLFFSYATVDDKERLHGDVETRWVTYFRKCLLQAVDRKIGRDDSIKVFLDSKEFASSNAPLTRALIDALDKTAVFIAIVSTGYLHHECWCNLEREHFLASLGDTPEERAAKRRLWIILIEDIPNTTWQAAFFPDMKAQVFYEKDADGIARLPLPGDREVNKRFMARIDDLAKELTARLKEMRESSPPMRSDPLRRVFLAECTPDLETDQSKMKCFLEERGWLILPEFNYPESNYEALLERDLRSALAFVQLIGPYPWKRGGFDVRQNEKATTLHVPRFRRRDPGIEMNTVDEPHRTFAFAPDVIATGLVDFKADLDRNLRELWQAKQPAERPEGNAEPLVRVAVRAESRDPLWAQAWDWFQTSNILASQLTQEESFEEKHRTEPCHGFLMLCDAKALQEGSSSLRDHLDQCRQIQLREKDVARCPPVGVAYWPPPPPVWALLLRSGVRKMYRIVADAPAELDNFFAEVRRVAK
jgi:hypothetical protein